MQRTSGLFCIIDTSMHSLFLIYLLLSVLSASAREIKTYCPKKTTISVE